MMDRLARFWPNTEPVHCPECGHLQPVKRKPLNWRQFWWGGWTCSECGVEMDRWGLRLDTPESFS